MVASVPDLHTLEETERAVARHTSHLSLDVASMYAVSSIFRAGNAVRDTMTRDVLRPHDLTWTGFLVLWILWIWESRESHEVASAVGITKATLTGVVHTLTARGWVDREVPAMDRRRVRLTLTSSGLALMDELFPQFNAEESRAVSALTPAEIATLTNLLRKVVRTYEVEDDSPSA